MTRAGRIAAILSTLVVAVPVGAQEEGRVVETTVASRVLANRLGDPLERRVLVYLPPGYDRAHGARYPVVYLLHAFGADPRTWLGGEGSYGGLNVARTLDRLITDGKARETIVVMPDAGTRLGGAWYASSPVSGDWEEFIAGDLVRFVDSRFRTRAGPSGRGLAGQSMGGYGALRIALLRPGTFGAVLAMSPVLVEDPNPLGEAGARIALAADPGALESAPIPARVLWSRAAALSPDPGNPPAYARLPFDEGDEGRVICVPEVWERWTGATLRSLVAAGSSALKRTALRLEVGADDALRGEVERLSRQLEEAGVAHDLEVFDGGHVRGVRRRFERSVFQFFSRAFGAEAGDPNGAPR